MGHWSKDFVEHLRVVHFALVVACALLIVAATNTDASKMLKAQAQLDEIVKYERLSEKSATLLYEQTMRNAKIPTRWSVGTLVYLPKETVPQQTLATQIEAGPIDVTAGLGALPWEFVGSPPPSRVSNLAEFREYWNALHRGVRLEIPAGPRIHGLCSAQVELHKGNGSVELIARPPETKCEGGVTNFGSAFLLDQRFADNVSIQTKPDANGRLQPVLRAAFQIPDNQVLPKFRLHRPVLAEEIVVETQQINIDESGFKRLFFPNSQSGSFEQAFPELTSVASPILTSEFVDAQRRLAAQALDSEQHVSLMGFAIPLRKLAQWGAVVILSIQFYFWMHLHELAAEMNPSDEGWDVAWIGFYRSRVAFAASLVSGLILPLTAAIVLAFRIVTTASDYHCTAWVVGVLVVLTSLSLGLLTLLRILRCVDFTRAFTSNRKVRQRMCRPRFSSLCCRHHSR